MDDQAGRDRDKADAEIRRLLEEGWAAMITAYDARDDRGRRDRKHWMDLWAVWVARNGAAPDASPADATVDSERAAYLRASPQERANYDEVSYELAADDEWEAIEQLRDTLTEIRADLETRDAWLTILSLDTPGHPVALRRELADYPETVRRAAARLAAGDKNAKIAQADRVAAEAAWSASRKDAADDRRLNGAAITITIHFSVGPADGELDGLVGDLHAVCGEDDSGRCGGDYTLIARDAWGIKPCPLAGLKGEHRNGY